MSVETLSTTFCGAASASGSSDLGIRNGIANVRFFVRRSSGSPGWADGWPTAGRPRQTAIAAAANRSHGLRCVASGECQTFRKTLMWGVIGRRSPEKSTFLMQSAKSVKNDAPPAGRGCGFGKDARTVRRGRISLDPGSS